MAAISPDEAAKIIRDLLRIAKVAMPGHLPDEDPRVLVVRAAPQELEASSSTGRSLHTTSRARALDVARLVPKQPVEMSSTGISFVLDVPRDLVDALHDAQADFARLDPPETVGSRFGIG